MIEEMCRSGTVPSASGVQAETGSSHIAIRRALEQWASGTGQVVERRLSWKPVALGDVLALIPLPLHHLPMTFLELNGTGQPLTIRMLRLLLGLQWPELRNTAFFLLAIVDTNRLNNLAYFRQMDRCLQQLNCDLHDIDPDYFYPAYFRGDIVPESSPSSRLDMMQAYFRLIRLQDDYLSSLTAAQRAVLMPFTLRKVSDSRFWTQSSQYSEVRDAAKRRRKDRTDAVHAKFYVLRDVAERRQIQLSRLRTAFRTAVAQCQQSGTRLPMAFKYADEEISESNRITPVLRHFNIWTPRALYEQALVAFPTIAAMYANSRSLQDFVGDEKIYLLGYKLPALRSPDSLAEYGWFFRSAEESGWSTRAYLARLEYWPFPIRNWLVKLEAKLGQLFLPVDEWYKQALIGHAALQIFTKTGARVHEFLQIRLVKDKLVRVRLSEGHEVNAFWATPKGRTAEEPFFIDDRCVRALHAWWSFLRDVSQPTHVIPPDRGFAGKLQPAPYLWQFDGRQLDTRQVNCAISFLLSGVPLRTAAGEPFALTSHLFRHGFATEMRALEVPVDVIALLLKQKDVAVTDYYSQPSANMLIDLQRRIFESREDMSRAHIRAPAQIRRRVETALETVGALVPVLGGHCTVANQCPVAFSCMGCAGHAPDPSRRAQVIEFKAAYTQLAEIAEKQHLRAEQRKAMQIIANCEETLAEMELIEQADQAMAAPVILHSVGKGSFDDEQTI
ncbi:site-specific integrase [Chitinimonas sp. PSY-7]|uniref:site-specific integrase n=1 Tax=Chitinimonas sp. PSY-7 TaxID=3459088 RepID=UPI00403FDD2C